MIKNQTAVELAKEYEQLAIAATNDYCRLKRHEPENGFPALAKQIGFCTTMCVLWTSIARRLAEGPTLPPVDFGAVDYGAMEEETRKYYDEFGA